MGSGIVRHRCPKCNGNILLIEDLDESYLQCLQCGKIIYMNNPNVHQNSTVTAADKMTVSVPVNC